MAGANLLSHTEYPRDGLFIFVETGLLSLIHGFNYVPHLLLYALSLLLWQGFIIIIINLSKKEQIQYRQRINVIKKLTVIMCSVGAMVIAG